MIFRVWPPLQNKGDRPSVWPGVVEIPLNANVGRSRWPVEPWAEGFGSSYWDVARFGRESVRVIIKYRKNLRPPRKLR